MSKEILGIDVGGSGIKGALVDLENGELLSDRFKLRTPRPAKPDAIARVVKEIVDHFKYKGLVGCGFPTVVKQGRAASSGNLHPSIENVPLDKLFEKTTGNPFIVINDADAAGLAEMKFGAGKGHNGKVVVVTVGTGLGSGVFYKGKLVPNIELGCMDYRGEPIELFASDGIRKRDGLGWKEWIIRFNMFLDWANTVVRPDLIIIGGGASKHYHRFKAGLTSKVKLLPAQKGNHAGIIGAAMAASHINTRQKIEA